MPARGLENQSNFATLQIGKTEEHDAGNVWAGAFWELRKTLRPATFDKLLLLAWKNVDPAPSAAHLKVFPRELLQQDRKSGGGQDAQLIREVFSLRGLTL
jgi:hypothetical protein